MDTLHKLLTQLEATVKSIPGAEETERDIARLFDDIRDHLNGKELTAAVQAVESAVAADVPAPEAVEAQSAP